MTPQHTPKGARALVHTPAEVGKAYLAWAERLHDDPGIAWGVPSIDKKVIPMRAGELIAILSRPGHGKTSLLARLARLEAERIRNKYESPPYPEAVVYCTWEQSAEELNAMFQASKEYTISDIAWGRAPLDEIRKQSLQRASIPIWVIGHGIGRAHHKAPRLTPDTVLEAIESMEQDFEVKPTLMLFDYLQLIPSRNYNDRVQQVTEMPIRIKELALRIGCPAFCGVQAARRVDDRDDKIPEMRDAQWACLAGDARIRQPFTAQPVTIKELWSQSADGELRQDVCSLDTRRLRTVAGTITKIKRNPKEQVYKVDCGSFGMIRTNSRHKFYTPTGWRELKDLASGDWVALAKKEVNPYCTQISQDAAYVLGLLLGDGTLVNCLVLSNSEQEILDSFKDAVEREWPGYTTVVRKQTEWECWDSTIVRADGRCFPGCNEVLNWAREIGFFGLCANDKHVPPIQMDTPAVASLLAGLFTTDGGVSFRNNRPQVAFSSCSERLVKDVAYLLRRIGIKSTTRVQISEGKQDLHCLRVAGTDMLRFMDLVNIRGEKGRKLREFFQKNPRMEGRSMGDLLPPEWNLETIAVVKEHHLRSKYSNVKGRAVTRGRLLQIAEETGSEKLTRYATCDLVWVKIESIEPDGTEHTFDVHVPHYENLVANGFIVHNSSIEQTSDKIFGACRPIRYFPDGGLVGLEGYGDLQVTENLLILRLLKQRGDTGRYTWPLYFDPATLELTAMEMHHATEEIPL